MAHFTWATENEVFLEPVDVEHRELFQLANQLRSALSRGAESNRLLDGLHKLTAHVTSHFSHEESLMRAVGYPSYSWHKSQHDTARRRIKLFVPLIESGDEVAGELFLEFLEGWLLDHTLVTDKSLASFVRNYQRTHPVATILKSWNKPARVAKPAAVVPPVPPRDHTASRTTNGKQQ